MKKFCECLEKHESTVIKIKKKEMKLLTSEQHESYDEVKICYICGRKFEGKYANDKKYCKVRDHCYYRSEYRGAAHKIYNLRYSLSKKITKGFRNASNYDYHFIIKEVGEDFEGQVTCLGENCAIFPLAVELVKMENKL